MKSDFAALPWPRISLKSLCAWKLVRWSYLCIDTCVAHLFPLVSSWCFSLVSIYILCSVFVSSVLCGPCGSFSEVFVSFLELPWQYFYINKSCLLFGYCLCPELISACTTLQRQIQIPAATLLVLRFRVNVFNFYLNKFLNNSKSFLFLFKYAPAFTKYKGCV